MKNIYLLIIFVISLIVLISRQQSNYPLDNFSSAILSIFIFILFLFLISKYDEHLDSIEKKNKKKKNKKKKNKKKKIKRKKIKRKKVKSLRKKVKRKKEKSLRKKVKNKKKKIILIVLFFFLKKITNPSR